MAHIHRLIALVLFFALGSSFAAFPPTTEYEYTLPSLTSGAYFSSKLEACSAFAAYQQTLITDGGTAQVNVGASGGGNCYLNKLRANGTTQSNYAGAAYGSRPLLVCPSNSSYAGGQCSCDPGYVENSTQTACIVEPPPPCPSGETRLNGVCVPTDCPATSTRVNGLCVPDPDCPAGHVRVAGVCKSPPKCPAPGTSAGGFDSSSSAAQVTCFVGCVVSIPPADVGTPTPSGTIWHSTGSYTGAECAGTGSSGPGAGPGGGPTPGEGPGTGVPGTNGPGTGNTGGAPGTPAPTPTPPGTAPPPPVQPKPPNTDGSCPAGSTMTGTTCIANPVPPNSDGVCPAGTSKVSGQCVSSVPGPGGATGTPGGTGGTGGNGDGSGFGGDCSMGFACQGGDAIQCAIAKEQYVRNCRLFDANEDPNALRFFAEQNREGSQTGDLPGNESISLGPSRFDTTNALGAASGMTDLTVTVMGTSVSLPFSRVNPHLAMLGNVLLAVSFLIAARIVARG